MKNNRLYFFHIINKKTPTFIFSFPNKFQKRFHLYVYLQLYLYLQGLS